MDIPTEAYLGYALRFKPEEVRFQSECASWLPDRIIDCHAHCNLAEHVLSVHEYARRHMLSTFPYYSIEDSTRIQGLLYPGKKVRALRFPKTFRGVDHRSANEYLLQESPSLDRVAIFGLPEDIDYTVGMMRHPRCSALKMYWSYVDPPARQVYEFFRPEILEEAQALGVPIVLHLPQMIVRSLSDLVQVLTDFPRLHVAIAHLGLSKMLVPGLLEAYNILRGYECVSLDTALNPSADVVALALSCFGRERIMFGSDEPLNLIRSVAYTHPEYGQRIVADYLYHWADPTEHAQFQHLAVNAAHSHWSCVQAIRHAIECYPLQEREDLKHRVFYANAERFYGF